MVRLKICNIWYATYLLPPSDLKIALFSGLNIENIRKLYNILYQDYLGILYIEKILSKRQLFKPLLENFIADYKLIEPCRSVLPGAIGFAAQVSPQAQPLALPKTRPEGRSYNYKTYWTIY